MPEYTIIRPGGSFARRQGLEYGIGISAESAGSRAICMHRLHEQHESSIYVISGHADFWSGPGLEQHVPRGCRTCRPIRAASPSRP